MNKLVYVLVMLLIFTGCANSSTAPDSRKEPQEINDLALEKKLIKVTENISMTKMPTWC